ncbi:efflux RND transporter periplasmic adaptor subunit [Microbulbifer halophilus]|uniref:Efflux RND transporter periplasmic adaptor subunit n=1 Tax=Microbulbifer halophilus TaxID=453963 RepID=A0ABW5EFV4_9GAMM|nr:efflux RND transporter periplasmic adaptor subunit [Microbulbifer halophilus]MCW8128161.1 efflux RND transporter periplasmic adaptor subunit [Microbulbifer halophilus]
MEAIRSMQCDSANRSRTNPLLGLAFIACAFPPPFTIAQENDDTAITVEAIPVSARPIVEPVPVTGTLTPPRQAALSTEVEGLVSGIHADIGHRVAKGQPLLELDPELNEIARDAALAEVERSREALADARRRLDEAQRLVGDNHIAETEVKSLASEVRIRNAELRAAQIEARRQEALLQRHRIEAPFSGAISSRAAELGEWVSPGTELFELVAVDRLRADFQVPQRFYSRIDPDTPLDVRFDTGDNPIQTGRTYKANVQYKVPLSTSGARTFLLRTEIAGQESPELIPGMSVSATLLLGTDRRGIAVPRDAVLRYPDGRITVWVVEEFSGWNEPGTVREQQIATGLSFDGLIEIRSGLEVDQVVVTQGNESLQEGQEVILRKAR